MRCEQKRYERSFWGRALKASARFSTFPPSWRCHVSDDGTRRWRLCQPGCGSGWRRWLRQLTGVCSTDEHGSSAILSYRKLFLGGGRGIYLLAILVDDSKGVCVLCYAVASVVSDSSWPHGWYPPGSSVYEIAQARILEWIAMPSSRGSSWSRDWTQASCIAGRLFNCLSH